MKHLFVFCLFLVTIRLTSFGKDLGNESTYREVHGLFTDILQEYVFYGKVDYRKLRNDNRLEEYLAQMAAANPDTIADLDARLAFWINAYNAYTLKIICDNYPVKSINDLHFGGLYVGVLLKKTVWDKKIVIINGEKISLNHIEHNIIRPGFGDPRVHFALVCASKSCPPLRSEAYEGYKLNEQLNDQGRDFFTEKDKNHFELDTRTAYLSEILNWYEKDFGRNSAEVLRYAAQFLPEELARDILAFSEEWTVEYTDYDWRLNE